VAACRNRCGRLVRRPRSAFFSAALQGDDDGPGVAEDASELGPGEEAGEAVDVQESLELGHSRIVTSFPKRRKANFAWKTRRKLTPAIESYPHDFTKSLKI
jgi:hypothetical protein